MFERSERVQWVFNVVSIVGNGSAKLALCVLEVWKTQPTLKVKLLGERGVQPRRIEAMRKEVRQQIC